MLNKDVIEATKKKFEEELKENATFLFFMQEPKRLVVPDYLKGQECFWCAQDDHQRDLLDRWGCIRRRDDR